MIDIQLKQSISIFTVLFLISISIYFFTDRKNLKKWMKRTDGNEQIKSTYKTKDDALIIAMWGLLKNK